MLTDGLECVDYCDVFISSHLTAPIHCRASIAETLMQWHISTNLMNWEWTHSHYWLNYSKLLWDSLSLWLVSVEDQHCLFSGFSEFCSWCPRAAISLPNSKTNPNGERLRCCLVKHRSLSSNWSLAARRVSGPPCSTTLWSPCWSGTQRRDPALKRCWRYVCQPCVLC